MSTNDWICDDRMYAPGGIGYRLAHMTPAERKAFSAECKKKIEERKKRENQNH